MSPGRGAPPLPTAGGLGIPGSWKPDPWGLSLMGEPRGPLLPPHTLLPAGYCYRSVTAVYPRVKSRRETQLWRGPASKANLEFSSVLLPEREYPPPSYPFSSQALMPFLCLAFCTPRLNRIPFSTYSRPSFSWGWRVVRILHRFSDCAPSVRAKYQHPHCTPPASSECLVKYAQISLREHETKSKVPHPIPPSPSFQLQQLYKRQKIPVL